jgi:hypothetical protein
VIYNGAFFNFIILGSRMKKISLLISLLLLSFFTAAYAHGPVRGKLTATVTVDASAAEVWKVIGEYGDMSWHPSISDTRADQGNETGSVRVLTLKNGGQITEELKTHDDAKMSYKYKITDMTSTGTITHAGQEEKIPVLPVENYQATLSVKAKGAKSLVTWIATYYRGYVNNNPPAELNEEAADAAVTEVFTDGLTALAQKFNASASSSDIDVNVKR